MSTKKKINCLICLDDINDGLEFLPCIHGFHKECINNWIKEKPLCPICKIPVYVNTPEQLTMYNYIKTHNEQRAESESRFFHQLSRRVQTDGQSLRSNPSHLSNTRNFIPNEINSNNLVNNHRANLNNNLNTYNHMPEANLFALLNVMSNIIEPFHTTTTTNTTMSVEQSETPLNESMNESSEAPPNESMSESMNESSDTPPNESLNDIQTTPDEMINRMRNLGGVIQIFELVNNETANNETANNETTVNNIFTEMPDEVYLFSEIESSMEVSDPSLYRENMSEQQYNEGIDLYREYINENLDNL